jgi:hypothetical protein
MPLVGEGCPAAADNLARDLLQRQKHPKPALAQKFATVVTPIGNWCRAHCVGDTFAL